MAQSRVATRPADLPDYDNPPVNEVVIGIQFDQTAITGAHIGLFWEELRGEFPKASEQPPLERRIESFQPLRFSAPFLGFGSWPGSRHWLTSEDDVHLIQIQADRLLYNWRRGPHNATYPHFESLQEKFWSIAEKWSSFLEGIDKTLKLTQWEVSYINHILTPGHLALADVLSFWGGQLDFAMGGSAEAGRMEAQRILTENNSPWARMYVSITTGIRANQIPLIAFELTVRGPPPGGEDAWDITHDRLFKGRHQIVTAFDALTTEKMHALWGKRK